MESRARSFAGCGTALVFIRWAYEDATTDPTTATPSAPATCRATSFIALATPAFSTGTAPMTESVAGPMIQPIENAPTQNQTPSGQYGISGVHMVEVSNVRPSPARPAATTRADPTRCESFALEPAPMTRP